MKQIKSIKISIPAIGAKNENRNPEKELTDEIREFRESAKILKAMNDHETYLVVVFSRKEDKLTFCDEVGIVEHTFVDGYELAKALKVEPKKPSIKLPKPLSL